ncbi:6428_t:CDS:2 [Entrophospora sp. SA101]|nr:6428_t:CDS:2 [Entrophospora sp. SA101]
MIVTIATCCCSQSLIFIQYNTHSIKTVISDLLISVDFVHY